MFELGGITIFFIIVAGLVNMTDSTVFPTPSVSFKINLKGTYFYLSIEDEKIVARVRNFILRAFRFTLLLAQYIHQIEYAMT